MQRATFLAVLVVAVGLVSEAVAQETAKKAEPVKPAPSPSVAILGQWNEIGRKLIAMAEDFPEDKYDFKGAASADPFAARLIHAAAANYYFTNAVAGKKMPGEEDPPPVIHSELSVHLAGVLQTPDWSPGRLVVSVHGRLGRGCPAQTGRRPFPAGPCRLLP